MPVRVIFSFSSSISFSTRQIIKQSLASIIKIFYFINQLSKNGLTFSLIDIYLLPLAVSFQCVRTLLPSNSLVVIRILILIVLLPISLNPPRNHPLTQRNDQFPLSLLSSARLIKVYEARVGYASFVWKVNIG